jgi:succinyl-CoA synthetase beta subunit
MKLHEYQAKALLAAYGVPVPEGGVAGTAQEAKEMASRLSQRAQESLQHLRDQAGSAAKQPDQAGQQAKEIVPRLGPDVRAAAAQVVERAVVKAQVHAGGRGKAGGVKVAEGSSAVQSIATSLLGKLLVTIQTGPRGAPVNQVLVEETIDVDRELYLSIATDGGRRRPVVIASAAGGVEIEEVARDDPGQILQEIVDPAIGFQPFQGRRLARGIGLPTDLVRPFVDIIAKCYQAYMDKDCSLIEINPLVITKDQKLLALDAKVTIDDDALFRHPQEAKLADPTQDDPLEVEAGKYDISYVKLEGNVGCMVNGAGLAMATMDTIQFSGARPANFLDVGGGATEEKVAQAITIMLSDAQVERVLVNIFGGILRCDIAARGIVSAYKDAQRHPPLVVRMLGTNAEEGRTILAESGLPITQVHTLQEAATAIAG